MSLASQIARLIRWQDWAPGTIALLWVVSLYLAVAYDLAIIRFTGTFVLLIFFGLSQGTFAYLLNEWADRLVDRKQFKNNAFNGLSRLETNLILLLSGIAAFISASLLMPHPGFIILWMTWLAISSAYSLEPFRLKQKGLAGLFALGMAGGFLPVLLVFAAFDTAGGADMWLMGIAFAIHALTGELHRKGGLRNRIISDGQGEGIYGLVLIHRKFYAGFVMVDRIAIGFLVAITVHILMGYRMDLLNNLGIFLAGLYVVLFLGLLKVSIRELTGQIPASGDPLDRPLTQILHWRMLDFAIPAVLGAAATLRSPDYALILGMFLLWRILTAGLDRHWTSQLQDWAYQTVHRNRGRES